METKSELLEQVCSYWNTRAVGYSLDIQQELLGESGQDWLMLIQGNAPAKQYRKVLDIGCGPGFFEALLGGNGYHVTGIDYTAGMLAQAVKNATKTGANTCFYQMDAQNLAFADNSFDLIVTRNVMWNLEYPEKAYSEWKRVLRKGGKIILMDGNYYLHYFNPAYAVGTPGADHQHMEGIDINIINEIARKLPLSAKLRPQWDIKILEREKMETQILRLNKIMGADGSEIIRSFILAAQKL